jgi:hypothetical protein
VIPFFSLPRVRQVRDEMAMELQMLKTELEVPSGDVISAMN